MRMYMVDPKILCQKHLLAEHLSVHAFVSLINQGNSLLGYIEHNLLEVSSLYIRHGELSEEMIHRDLNHQSPLKPITNRKNKDAYYHYTVDQSQSFNDLMNTCNRCRERYESKHPQEVRK